MANTQSTPKDASDAQSSTHTSKEVLPEDAPQPRSARTTLSHRNDSSAQLAEVQKQLDEAMDGWKRARADYQNLQKRTLEDVVKARKQGKSATLLDLLPVVDNVQAALGSIPEDLQDHPWTKGVQYVSQQFEQFLSDQGLQEIHVEKIFDPSKHEAVKTVPAKDGQTPGEIVSVSRKGYLLADHVLRPAGVVVAGE